MKKMFSRKGIGASMIVGGALVLIIIIIFAIFVGQRMAKTEETVFGKFLKKIFPSRTETVVISGTTVGQACKTITLPTDEAQGISTFTQAVVDCYNDGQYIHKNTIQCCYNIDASNITYDITEDEFKQALDAKGIVGQTVKYSGFYCGQNYEWKIAQPLTASEGKFIICYDYQGWTKLGSCDDVFMTKTPDVHCD